MQKEKRKIYDTPYYAKLLEDLHFQSKKKNGVGGAILYGPPGTGKTELIDQKNKEQGYATRRINIHHYVSFDELMASKAIQLGVSKGAANAEKLKHVIDTFEHEDPGKFIETMGEMYAEMKRDGKLSDQQDFVSFLTTMIDGKTSGLLRVTGISADQLLGDDKSSIDFRINNEEYPEGNITIQEVLSKVKEGFLKRQKARIARTTLAETQQEDVIDLIKGEILQAAADGERACLDEIDKAGPNSLGGILTFLARSPGEEFKIGNTKITIPQWFTVDATSNSTELNEFLKDRFTQLYVGTPPVKDQLMIATVKVCDEEGNILIPDYVQRQMVGFYMYMVPEINRVLEEAHYRPLSNRNIQEFTSYLADLGKGKATDKKFNDVVRSVLLKHQMWTQDEKVSGAIEKILKRYDSIMIDEPIDANQKPEAGGFTDLRDKRNLAYKKTVSSPLLIAINNLPDEPGDITPRIDFVELNDSQKSLIDTYLKSEDNKARVRGDVMQLRTGTTMFKTAYETKDTKKPETVEAHEESDEDEEEVTQSSKEQAFIVYYMPENGKSHEIVRDRIDVDGRIVSASADGKTVILTKSSDETYDYFQKITLFGSGQAHKSNIGAYIHKGGIVTMDRHGKVICSLDSSNKLNVYRESSDGKVPNLNSVPNLRNFAISPDGQLLLVEDMYGVTKLLSSETLKVIMDNIPGTSWTFAGEHLIVQKQEGGVAGQKAFLVH